MYITIKELQAEISVSRPTIYSLIKEGMPHFRVGERIRFDRDEVIQWFKDRSVRRG